MQSTGIHLVFPSFLAYKNNKLSHKLHLNNHLQITLQQVTNAKVVLLVSHYLLINAHRYKSYIITVTKARTDMLLGL